MAHQPGLFGPQVRALRHGVGLSQAELAERAGISERTVSDVERGLRTSVYPATARQLARALQVDGDRLAAFLLAAQGKAGNGDTAAREIGLLPAAIRARMPASLTRLFGRDLELAMLLDLVRSPATRLVTIVGPGGVGKTRLALEVAESTQDEFPGGTYFVDLSALDDAALVVPAIAGSVGIQPGPGELAPQLVRRLSGDRSLVVLDTFEHVLAAAVEVGRLVAACPALVVMVTGRSGLDVRGERQLPLRPLAVDGAVDGVQRAAAVELFFDRARAVLPDLAETPSDVDVVRAITARLDGLPLAIELAAARVKHMPLPDLLKHLDRRLDPLVGGSRDLPPRHQTMRAALDWSYALLTGEEMRLYRCLGVFRGGFDRKGAAFLAARSARPRDADSLETLSNLVNSSLVRVETDPFGEARYGVLDLVREHAGERSQAAGDLDLLRHRHAQYFLFLAERAEPELRGAGQHEWQRRMLQEEGNFRAALTWARESGDAELRLRLAGALWMFWRWAGLFTEGRAWLDGALADGRECSTGARLRGLWGAGWLAYNQGDYSRTDDAGRQMLALLGNSADALHRRNALTLVGNAALAEGKHDEAIVVLREALSLCQPAGESWYLATSLLNVGTAQLSAGLTSDALPVLERAMVIYETIGDRHFMARCLLQVSQAHIFDGQFALAAVEVRRAVQISEQLGDGWSLAEGLEAVANLVAEENPASAATMAGAADRIREQIAMRPHPADASANRRRLNEARARLDPGEFDRAWSHGRGLPLAQVMSMAAVACAAAGPGG